MRTVALLNMHFFFKMENMNITRLDYENETTEDSNQ